MSKYNYLYSIWLLPLYFVLQAGYQMFVYSGLNQTYDKGTSHVAEVIDFDVKQIAAQTNGYVVIRFTDNKGGRVEEKLSLPVQMAQVLTDSEIIPVRYLSNSPKPIVLIPVFSLQKEIILMNIAVSSISFLIVVIIAIFVTRYANKMRREGEEKLEVEFA